MILYDYDIQNEILIISAFIRTELNRFQNGENPLVIRLVGSKKIQKDHMREASAINKSSGKFLICDMCVLNLFGYENRTTKKTLFLKE